MYLYHAAHGTVEIHLNLDVLLLAVYVGNPFGFESILFLVDEQSIVGGTETSKQAII